MKKVKIIMLLMAVFCMSKGQGQVKKASVPKGKDTSANVKRVQSPLMPFGTQDSTVVRFLKYTDTLKVRITVYVDDYSTAWMKGYMLMHYRKYTDTPTPQQDGKPEYADNKFARLSEDDILSVGKYDWK